MLENTTFRKLDLFPSSVEGRETPALLGPLERANLNHWTNGTQQSRCLPPLTWGQKQIQFLKYCVALICSSLNTDQSWSFVSVMNKCTYLLHQDDDKTWCFHSSKSLVLLNRCGEKDHCYAPLPSPCFSSITERAVAYNSCSLHVSEDVSTISYSFFICTCDNACTDVCRYNSSCGGDGVARLVNRWSSLICNNMILVVCS
jgi:hypothetical protein